MLPGDEACAFIQGTSDLAAIPEARAASCKLLQQVTLEAFAVTPTEVAQQRLRGSRRTTQVHDSTAFGASLVSALNVERVS